MYIFFFNFNPFFKLMPFFFFIIVSAFFYHLNRLELPNPDYTCTLFICLMRFTGWFFWLPNSAANYISPCRLACRIQRRPKWKSAIFVPSAPTNEQAVSSTDTPNTRLRVVGDPPTVDRVQMAFRSDRTGCHGQRFSLGSCASIGFGNINSYTYIIRKTQTVFTRFRTYTAATSVG